MNYQLYIIITLSFLVLILFCKNFLIRKKFTQYIIDNNKSDKNNSFLHGLVFYESVKILNKKYRIGKINAYVIINSLNDKDVEQ